MQILVYIYGERERGFDMSDILRNTFSDIGIGFLQISSDLQFGINRLNTSFSAELGTAEDIQNTFDIDVDILQNEF